MSNQNTKMSPGIEFALFNCTREIRMENFDWIAHFILILICNNLQKKFYGVRRLTAEPLTTPHAS